MRISDWSSDVCSSDLVLTRGNTLKPGVILLGGPNTYLPFLQECWKLRIPETWRDRGFEPPPGKTIDEMIFVPKNADLYAAFGAARSEERRVGKQCVSTCASRCPPSN